ncbi:unnamed protein product [Schistosoma margrebowiei]|uniref:Uncharacterized protein n=1 Tax=Schistosoma margrebowiei TaxID=48269 RepID=A0A183N0L0_9TREM|nr:unnamed protein product [Schistosoma margrebowiei]
MVVGDSQQETLDLGFGLLSTRQQGVLGQPYYSGSYILLKPGQCVKNVRAYGLLSIGSILQCAQIALFGYLPTLNCYYPQQPWRQLASLSPVPPVMPLTPTLIVTQQTMPQLKTGSVSLLDLQKSSLNIT